jgi:hypothetical protein
VILKIHQVHRQTKAVNSSLHPSKFQIYPTKPTIKYKINLRLQIKLVKINLITKRYKKIKPTIVIKQIRLIKIKPHQSKNHYVNLKMVKNVWNNFHNAQPRVNKSVKLKLMINKFFVLNFVLTNAWQFIT